MVINVHKGEEVQVDKKIHCLFHDEKTQEKGVEDVYIQEKADDKTVEEEMTSCMDIQNILITFVPVEIAVDGLIDYNVVEKIIKLGR